PPSPAVSTQRAPVLGDAAVAALGRHHFNAVSFFKLSVQLVGIVSLVADQPLRQLVQELPASASSTNWHTADEALSTATASGRLLPAAIAMIFVPLPRRVGPTAKPPFLRSRRLHPRTLLPDSVVR